ncbi:unnamed protein product [Jaminaea pallidilutea]
MASQINEQKGNHNGAYHYYDNDDDDPAYATEGYQGGRGGGAAAAATAPNQQYHAAPSSSIASQQGSILPTSMSSQTQPDHASYVTSSHGLSISGLCFAAWALPPFSGVLALIFETSNDLVRFHAYQSSLCGVAVVLALYVLRSWFGWYTISLLIGMGSLGASWVAGSNAHRAAPTLSKEPYLPYVGPLADDWVGSE